MSAFIDPFFIAMIGALFLVIYSLELSLWLTRQFRFSVKLVNNV